MTYSAKEVRGLLKRYYELRQAKDTSPAGLSVLVLLADLERALGAMPGALYDCVIRCGVHNVSSREAAERLGVSHVTVQKRIDNGISWIVLYLNEGIE